MAGTGARKRNKGFEEGRREEEGGVFKCFNIKSVRRALVYTLVKQLLGCGRTAAGTAEGETREQFKRKVRFPNDLYTPKIIIIAAKENSRRRRRRWRGRFCFGRSS